MEQKIILYLVCLIFAVICLSLTSKYLVADYYEHEHIATCIIKSCNKTVDLHYDYIEYKFLLHVELTIQNKNYSTILEQIYYRDPGVCSINNTLIINDEIECSYNDRDIVKSLSLEPIEEPHVGIFLIFIFVVCILSIIAYFISHYYKYLYEQLQNYNRRTENIPINQVSSNVDL